MATARTVPDQQDVLHAATAGKLEVSPTTKIVTEPLNPHSVTLTRSTTGVISIEVKSYGPTTEAAMEETRRIFDRLVKLYPYQR